MQAAKGKFDPQETRIQKDADLNAKELAQDLESANRSRSLEHLKQRVQQIKEKIDHVRAAYRDQLILVKQENLFFKQSI